MPPDFNKKTIDTIAKRAAYICSNPDCRVLTVGPNTCTDKSISLGECAHINGARDGSKRYLEDMPDIARAAITNAIWLCRNCHKLIDSDETQYSEGLLFLWREKHDQYILGEIGNASDKFHASEQGKLVEKLQDYPPHIRRIAIDQPDGWEWYISAELMKFLNEPIFRTLSDMKDGIISKEPVHIPKKDASEWFENRFTEGDQLIEPLPKLFNRLSMSWGLRGQSGHLMEIVHSCRLISDCLQRISNFEEKLYLVRLPSEYDKALASFRNVYASEAFKIQAIPHDLMDLLKRHEEIESDGKPIVIRRKIIFELPKGWAKKLAREVTRANNFRGGSQFSFSRWFFIVLAIYVLFKVATGQ